MANPFLKLKLGAVTPLDGADGMPQAGHRWEQPQIDALVAAYAADRPLLVRGEAGSGKSQLARAAAAVLGSRLLKDVIHGRFEARDLLYRFDALQRLADAQANLHDKVKDIGQYVRHGKLWQALDECKPGAPRPVLLIDEIDKADADVPNALLDVLGNGRFECEWTHETVAPASGVMPLIVITTNEERELPAAFVRRCLVLNLNPPKDEGKFKAWLLRLASAHTSIEIDPEVVSRAADKVWADRCAAMDAGQQRVGLAEYVDLLRALHELTLGSKPAARAAAQGKWLDRLGAYFLVKGNDMDQARAAQVAGLKGP